MDCGSRCEKELNAFFKTNVLYQIISYAFRKKYVKIAVTLQTQMQKL